MDAFDLEVLQSQFELMGARLKVVELALPPILRRQAQQPALDVRVDIRQDKRGAFFLIEATPRVTLAVVDSQPAERHLLLLARAGAQKDKFLCGHDERDWFVAAIPEERGVRNVATAREALKPAEVRAIQRLVGMKTTLLARRKTDAYLRQGEWFFIPTP
jgi:hypothetical protein